MSFIQQVGVAPAASAGSPIGSPSSPTGRGEKAAKEFSEPKVESIKEFVVNVAAVHDFACFLGKEFSKYGPETTSLVVDVPSKFDKATGIQSAAYTRTYSRADLAKINKKVHNAMLYVPVLFSKKAVSDGTRQPNTNKGNVFAAEFIDVCRAYFRTEQNPRPFFVFSSDDGQGRVLLKGKNVQYNTIREATLPRSVYQQLATGVLSSMVAGHLISIIRSTCYVNLADPNHANNYVVMDANMARRHYLQGDRLAKSVPSIQENGQTYYSLHQGGNTVISHGPLAPIANMHTNNKNIYWEQQRINILTPTEARQLHSSGIVKAIAGSKADNAQFDQLVEQNTVLVYLSNAQSKTKAKSSSSSGKLPVSSPSKSRRTTRAPVSKVATFAVGNAQVSTVPYISIQKMLTVLTVHPAVLQPEVRPNRGDIQLVHQLVHNLQEQGKKDPKFIGDQNSIALAAAHAQNLRLCVEELLGNIIESFRDHAQDIQKAESSAKRREQTLAAKKLGAAQQFAPQPTFAQQPSYAVGPTGTIPRSASPFAAAPARIPSAGRVSPRLQPLVNTFQTPAPAVAGSRSPARSPRSAAGFSSPSVAIGGGFPAGGGFGQ